MNSALCNLATQTNGDISISVIGPVRSGKSTFLSNFLQKVVMPRVDNDKDRERCRNEMPQTFDGKGVVTTQPQFVPSKGVNISFEESKHANIQLIDSVGYPITGAEGIIVEDGVRKIATPWSNEPLEFEMASKVCAQKLSSDLSNVVIIVTSDGSFVDIARDSYALAEEKILLDIKTCGKPIVAVFNTTAPMSESTQTLCQSLESRYNLPVVPMDVENATDDDFRKLTMEILKEFPIRKIGINLPKWMRALSSDCKVVAEIIEKVKVCSSTMAKMKDVNHICDDLQCDCISNARIEEVNLGNGAINYNLEPTKDLFFKVLSNEANVNIDDEFSLMSYVTASSYAKRQFEIFKDAIAEADANGYGVVYPLMQQMTIDEPQMVKQASIYGVKLTAKAPSYHIIKVDVSADVSPLVGTEEQSQYLLEQYKSDPKKIWNTNMFGRSMSGIASDGMMAKCSTMPVEVKQKLTRTVNRIVNENKGGLICILL